MVREGDSSRQVDDIADHAWKADKASMDIAIAEFRVLSKESLKA